MKGIIFISLLILSACNIKNADLKIGMSMSNEQWAKPDVDLPNPLGLIRVEYETENQNIVFCEHISSLPKVEVGSGLNHCGFLIEL